jgi:hypothetical protein
MFLEFYFNHYTPFFCLILARIHFDIGE